MTAPNTRDRILEVAARLFQEQGFAATGVSTILREADVNSGSLYHFFPSKDALLVGVLERYLELLHPIVLSPREEATTDPIERIFLLLAWYRAGLEAMGCAIGCPIGNLALEVSDTHPEIRPLIHQNFLNWKAGIERWLADAGDRLPASVDRKDLASLILTVMEGGVMQSRAERTLAPFDASVKQLRQYFDLLLAQRSGRGDKRSKKSSGNAKQSRQRSGHARPSKQRSRARETHRTRSERAPKLARSERANTHRLAAVSHEPRAAKAHIPPKSPRIRRRNS
jgi:TetR/AcrR family transcriptional regulator, transcriptional repressor for nem operon